MFGWSAKFIYGHVTGCYGGGFGKNRLCDLLGIVGKSRDGVPFSTCLPSGLMAVVANGSDGVCGPSAAEIGLICGSDMDACFTAFDKDGYVITINHKQNLMNFFVFKGWFSGRERVQFSMPCIVPKWPGQDLRSWAEAAERNFWCFRSQPGWVHW